MNILWIPHTPWHVPQRTHFFAANLVRRHALHVTNWDGDFSGVSDLMTRRYLLNLLPRRWSQEEVSVHHIPRFSPALHSLGLRSLNQRLFQASLGRILPRHEIDVVVGTFVTSPPDGVPCVADIVDDNVSLWLESGVGGGYEQEIARHEAAWIERSHCTVVVSSVLAEKVQARHPGARVVRIPNGVDLAVYTPASKLEARRRLDLPVNAKIIGNIGMIHSQYEAERLLAVAKRISGTPSVKLLIAGGGKAMSWLESEVARARLESTVFAGFLEGEALLNAFRALDVGLCPYKLSPGDDARVPMRLLHYSAVGARVVAPELEELRRMAFPNVLLSKDDHGRFAEAALTSLDLGASVPDELMAYDVRRLTSEYEALLEAARGHT